MGWKTNRKRKRATGNPQRVFHRRLGGASRLFFVAAAGIVLSMFMRTDYSGIGVLAVVVMYAMRKRRCAGLAAVSLVLSVYTLFELPAFLSVIPVYFYDGSRGAGAKWLFYIFYPAHLLVLWGICMMLGIVS